MVKNEDTVRVRLQRAALELFRERGYDQTTAAEIATRAGVTERTFFRHFPDKREVLFDGEATLRAALAASIADAPDGLGPGGCRPPGRIGRRGSAPRGDIRQAPRPRQRRRDGVEAARSCWAAPSSRIVANSPVARLVKLEIVGTA